jgi:histone H3/H4
MAETDKDPALTQALERIRAEFDGGGPNDLSDRARAALLEAHAEFVEELGVEAVRSARRSRSDAVSEIDIEEARRIVQSPSKTRLGEAMGAVGGVLAGAGAGQLFAVLSQKNPSTAGYAAATIGLVVGSILLAMALGPLRR